MRKYENFCQALENMKEIYKYHEPYDTVILTGLVGLYEICFKQSWKMMKEILELHGFTEGATGSPKIILKTASLFGIEKSSLKSSIRPVSIRVFPNRRPIFFPIWSFLTKNP